MHSSSVPNSESLYQPLAPPSDSSRTSARWSRIWALRFLVASLAVLLLFAGGQAELAAQQAEEQPPYPNSVQPLNAGQLEQLVAPIALYPDALVAQILAASTYPTQVADADQWRQAQNYASPEEIAAGAGEQAWDPSVMALTAFPRVLAQMDQNLHWTSDLGNAYYNQPQDVLEAVQVMRRRAQEAGNLQSTPQEAVRYEQGYIELAPVSPQVVYVPAYNPWTVYGDPVSPYPGFSLLDAVGEFFSSSALHYGVGVAMAAFSHTPWGWLAWGLNWLTQAVLFNHSDYSSQSSTVTDWGFPHRGLHSYSGREGFARFGSRYAGMHGGESWRHTGSGGNPWHSFARNSMRSDGWSAHSSRGFESFHSTPATAGGYGPRQGTRVQGRATYASNFYHSPAGDFRRGGFGNRSYSPFSGRNYGSSGKTAHSSGFHFSNVGRKRSSGGRSWGGFHSGGGRAPKSFGGGRSFGGGHSHWGGHSGGHGSSKRRR